jgi:hypothetical protein
MLVGMTITTTPPSRGSAVRYGSVDRDYARALAASDDRYAPVEILTAIGAEVVLFADVQHQPIGATPRWHRIHRPPTTGRSS